MKLYDEGVCGPSQMFESENGDWVRHEDHVAALTEATALLERVEPVLEALRCCDWSGDAYGPDRAQLEAVGQSFVDYEASRAPAQPAAPTADITDPPTCPECKARKPTNFSHYDPCDSCGFKPADYRWPAAPTPHPMAGSEVNHYDEPAAPEPSAEPSDYGIEHALLVDWTNSLLEPFKKYVYLLSTGCAGDIVCAVREAICQRENAMALAARVRELESAEAQLAPALTHAKRGLGSAWKGSTVHDELTAIVALLTPATRPGAGEKT